MSKAIQAYQTEKKTACCKRLRWVSNKWANWQGLYSPSARRFLVELDARSKIVIDGRQIGQATITLMLLVTRT